VVEFAQFCAGFFGSQQMRCTCGAALEFLGRDDVTVEPGAKHFDAPLFLGVPARCALLG
jgi:hypothetical protein